MSYAIAAKLFFSFSRIFTFYRKISGIRERGKNPPRTNFKLFLSCREEVRISRPSQFVAIDVLVACKTNILTRHNAIWILWYFLKFAFTFCKKKSLRNKNVFQDFIRFVCRFCIWMIKLTDVSLFMSIIVNFKDNIKWPHQSTAAPLRRSDYSAHVPKFTRVEDKTVCILIFSTEIL